MPATHYMQLLAGCRTSKLGMVHKAVLKYTENVFTCDHNLFSSTDISPQTQTISCSVSRALPVYVQLSWEVLWS